MQDLVKRYFWVLGAAVVLVCCVFAAKATSHVIEAKYLGDSSKTPHIVPVVPSPMQQPVKKERSKDGTQFAARNMFCSDCTPAVVVATNTDPSQIQTTSLPLQLLATMVAADSKDSYATIVNTDNQHQGGFSVGDPIPGATGKLIGIHYQYVDFENSGHTERLVLAGATPPPSAPVAAVEQPSDGE